MGNHSAIVFLSGAEEMKEAAIFSDREIAK